MNQIAEVQTAFNPFNRNRAIFFSAVAVALAILSFHGALDELAFSKLVELKETSIALLVVSRGINAIVSVLQSIEFGAIVSSVEIGQMLDPVNDAAERLSVALMWAIGSLFLQDILLNIVSGRVLKWGFLVITVLTVGTLLLAQSDRLRAAILATFGVSHVTLAQIQGFLIKTFVVATIFRFIVPTFAVASFLVSQALVAPELEKQKEKLEESTRVVETISGVPTDSDDPEAEVRVLKRQRAQLDAELVSHRTEEKELTRLISERKKSDWLTWPIGDDPDEALVKSNTLVREIESEINQKESELACIERRTVGEECEVFFSDHRNQVLGDLRQELESQQAKLRKQLALLLKNLEEWKRRANEVVKKVEDKKDSVLRGVIPESMRGIFGEDSEKKPEETNERSEELDPEIADIKTSEERNASKLECVERLLAGEHCDSLDEDEYVGSALSMRKEELEAELPPLRMKLASHQGEQTRLAELVKFSAQLGQIEKRIEETRELIGENESALECAEQRVGGEDCITFIEQIKVMTVGVLDGFKEIVGATQDMVGRMAIILILVVIENIVLPIIFLAIAVKGSVPIARGVMQISTSMREDTREALSALDRALPGRTD